METRYDALIAIVAATAPTTVRGAFYQAEVSGIVEKQESGYDKVQRGLVTLRRDGRVAYADIVDRTREVIRPYTCSSVADALRDTVVSYRRSLWDDMPVRTEVWLEKQALAGVIEPVTGQYDVPLMVARGYSSETFIADAAEAIANFDRPAFVYYLADYDPSGQDAARAVRETLGRLAPTLSSILKCWQ